MFTCSESSCRCSALAASAPILQFPGIYQCNQYYDIITKDFTNYSPLCSSSIRNSWKAMRHVASNEEGRAWLTAQFQLCKPLKQETVDDFVAFILNAWDSMSMTDYPAPANFLNPMPAYPIKHACKYLTTPNADERALIKTIYQGRTICEFFCFISGPNILPFIPLLQHLQFSTTTLVIFACFLLAHLI